MALIEVRRPDAGYACRLRDFKIAIDGQHRGGVGRGRAEIFEVSAGTHQVRAGIDWCRSRKVGLTVGPGDHAVLVCRNPPFAAPLWMFWATLGCRRYPLLALDGSTF
jgi:hypothetical protein